MKKVLSLVLALALVCGLALNAFAADFTATPETTSVQAGEDVTVVISLNETVAASEGVTSIGGTLTYDDSVFTIKEYTLADAYSFVTPTVSKRAPEFKLAWFSVTSTATELPAGTIATVVFTAKEDLTAAAVASFTLDLAAQTALGETVVSNERAFEVSVCTGHEWDEGVATEHNCDEDFEIVYTCYNCGATKSETKEATGHVASAWPAKEYNEDYTMYNEYATCEYCYQTFGDPVTYYMINFDSVPTTTIEVAPGETVNYEASGFGGLQLVISGGDATIEAVTINMMSNESTTVTYESVDGVTTIPVSGYQVKLHITNTGSTTVAYGIDMIIPVGDMSNPDVLYDGENSFDIPADTAYGYYTSYTPVCDGTLTITVSGERWDYQVVYDEDPDNWSDGYTSDFHNSSDDVVVNTETLQVKAGYPVVVILSTLNYEDWTYPAGTITVNVEFAPEHSVAHVDAVTPSCFEEGNIEYWYCEVCGAAWEDEAMTKVTNQMSVKLPAACQNVIHVEAKAPSCFEEGNIEHWYCEVCDQVWQDEARMQLTNHQNVKLPAACQKVVHVPAKEATCFETGNIEYWYCEECLTFWQDENLMQVTNSKNVILPVSHSIKHVEAVAATCTAEGNIEHWYCEDCGYAWLDEYCTKNTNLKAVVLAKLDHVDEDKNNICDDCKYDMSSAQTGDSSNVYVVMAVMLVAMMGVVALAVPAVRKNFIRK